MATASSAQREPSMEEILASIRRIIEDSDGGRKPADALDTSAAEDADVESDIPDIAQFRAELRAGSAEPEPPRPVSLAEVQAQVASNQPASTARAVEPVVGRTATLAEVGARLAAERDEQTTPAATASEPGRDAIARPDPAEAADEYTGSQDNEPRVEIDDDDLVLEHEPQDEPIAQSAAFRPALVSEQTSRQVAAAFGELSDAFASRSKRSVDEMAEEMLRPMLQDWLDNNLPTLVERLVREEIERVARGA